MGQGLNPRPLGYEPNTLTIALLGEALIVLKSTSLPIVSSVERASEYVRRAALLVNAVFLTSSVRADRIGLVVEEEIVVIGVVKGAVAVVVTIRAM